ncbi:MAG: M28 family peptidase, partial [Gemmatimonadota bacterium]
MTRRLILLGAISLAAVKGNAQVRPGPATRIATAIQPATFESHLHFLSDDLLEGRAPGTRGGRLAGIYIAAQFESMGLTPAGKNGGWFQPFDIEASRIVRSELTAGGERFAPGRDQALLIVGSDTLREYQGRLVFVGYGVVAPEYQWDDYKDVDVRGKLVVAIAGHPGQVDSTIFTGSGSYGTRSFKTLEAIRHGAIGALVIHRPAETGYAWSSIARNWFSEDFALAERDTMPAGRPGISGWIRDSTGARLMTLAGLDLPSLVRQSARRDFRPLLMGIEVHAATSVKYRTIHARNVAGLWPGQGAGGRDAVVLGAHYDHLGIGPAVNGDSIYNGAEDNATGVAGVLAIADAFAHTRVVMPRSVLFIAFDAEEVGLLGSEAYVKSPLIPLEHTAAMLNVDGVNPFSRTTDTWALGMEYSELESVFRRAAKAEGLAVKIGATELQFIEDQHFFTRSDHYSFARAGVPALFLGGGYTAVGKPGDWMQQKLEEYLSTRYHRPGDEVLDWYSFEGGIIDLRILARALYAVAVTPRAPQWRA